MRKHLITVLIAGLAITAFAGVRHNTDCYLYELKGSELVLIQKHDSPVVAKGQTQGVIILDKGKEPTQAQMDNLKSNIQKRFEPVIYKDTRHDSDIVMMKSIINRTAVKAGVVLTVEEQDVLKPEIKAIEIVK